MSGKISEAFEILHEFSINDNTGSCLVVIDPILSKRKRPWSLLQIGSKHVGVKQVLFHKSIGGVGGLECRSWSRSSSKVSGRSLQAPAGSSHGSPASICRRAGLLRPDTRDSNSSASAR